jgi:formylglycine-generating enzyme required for sulfatase activity
MVYIPTGNFFLGSGAEAPTDFSDPLNPSNPENAELNEFYRYDAGDTDARTPFSVLNEGEILVGQNTGQLYYQNTNNRGGDRLDIPAGFPKGHAAFYLQKYETTQQQWVSFFNTLTVQQKANRDITGDPGKDSDAIVDRNAIEWDGAGDASIIGGSGTETNKDREYVAIGLNYVSQQDMLAYLDWAALRPMTELEFEKAARGTLNSERNEYVWGTPRVTTEENNLLNDVKRSAEEAVGVNAYPDITTPGPRIGMANYTEAESSSAGERGPFRAGIFAGSPQNPNPNDRINTGAGYYGNMELAGNLLEGVVNVGRAQGLAFRNINGDGELDANGNANVPTWPNSTDGLSVRGGAFDSEDVLLHTSDRSLGVTFSTSRGHTSRRRNLQFRGVRGL